jgi:branched-subunit amino acid aminotransferase/4-amino-4-deoxychorismate lyase
MKQYCYADGKIMPTVKASVPVNDLVVLRGYAVFDFLKTVNGKPFLWLEHWRRFLNSAKQLNLKVPVGEREAREIVAALLKKNKVRDASIRLVLTGGATTDGISIKRPNFFILIEDLYVFPPRVFRDGAKVMTHAYLRLVPEAKTTNYITAVRLAKEKKRAGALEILYLDRGRMMECSTSNFFIVKDGKIITPKDEILLGTIRNLVIKLARDNGLSVEEREVKVGELATADETFLTATNKDITPVIQIDERKIGLPRAESRGKPGPLTRQLMQIYAEHLAAY